MADRKKVLDLHGVRHVEVERLVENFVLLNEPPLKIINGNSDMMRDIVLTKLNKLRMSWEMVDFTIIRVWK